MNHFKEFKIARKNKMILLSISNLRKQINQQTIFLEEFQKNYDKTIASNTKLRKRIGKL